VVERNGRYVILMVSIGFLAAQKLELKELNIREKSFVALNIYRQYLAEKPQLLETDPCLNRLDRTGLLRHSRYWL